MFFDSVEMSFVSLRTRDDPWVVNRADAIGLSLVVLDDRCVPTDMVGVVMRDNKVVKPADMMSLEILQDVLAIGGEVTHVD